MKRRNFIMLLGGAVVASPRTGVSQHAIPAVGLLRSTPSAGFDDLVTALKRGLAETGFDDGRNVVIVQRWADNKPELLSDMATELIRRKMAVVVGNQQAILAAKARTATTPIVFVTGEDPVKAGYVNSLSRPGGNLTGVTFFAGSQLNAKRIEILHELVPRITRLGVLVDVNYASFEAERPELEAAARVNGWQTVIERVAAVADLEPAFARISNAGAEALLVSGSPFFTSERNTVAELAARRRLPAISDLRNFVVAGGLISYSSSITDAYRLAGTYAGQILKGAKPAELPVQQATVFELAINLKTAKELGLTVPPALLARANEVIE